MKNSFTIAFAFTLVFFFASNVRALPAGITNAIKDKVMSNPSVKSLANKAKKLSK